MQAQRLQIPTATIAVDQAHDGSPAVKKLKLTLNEDRIDVYGLLTQAFNSNANTTQDLIDIINAILEFLKNYDKKWTHSERSVQSEGDTLALLISQYKKLTAINVNENNVLKLKSASLMNNDINVEILILRCIYKLIRPETLSQHAAQFLAELSKTRNNKIIYEMMKIIEKLLHVFEDSAFKASLLPFIKKFLKNNDHLLREICLQILSLHFIKHDSFNDTKIIEILLSHSEDQDSRVRVAALELLILLHEKGYKVNVKHYETLKHRLTDDFDQVRLLATKLIWLLAITYPEYMVDVGSDLEVEELRLIDEVFGKICNMINDLSLEVKVQAAKLLGDMNGVSSRFLLQTLDKKLMKDLKIKSSKSSQKTLFSSEYSATMTVIPTASSDAQLQEEESLSLISTGACGAFIHGLEDEFLEVRGECVVALGKLAVHCPQFAAKSIDFLVDMFNDEIENVRLMSIQALCKITHYVLLTDDQIEIVLPGLEDGTFEVRESLRDLLSNCKLSTKNGFKKTVQALVNTYKKYHFDKQQIWKCCQNLGKNHSKFVLILVPYLLSLHPIFELPQPDMEDPIYICCLLIIYNAAKINPTLLPLLPKYVFDHYFFLRSKLPELTPIIEFIDDDFNANEFLNYKTKKLDFNENEEVSECYQNIINNLIVGNNLHDDYKIKLYESIDNDLNHLGSVEPTLSAACEVMHSFVKCLLIIQKQQSEPNLNKIEEALLISTKLLSLYKGYSQEEKTMLFELNHFLRSLYLRHSQHLKKAISANLNNMTLTFEQTVILRRDLIKESKSYLNYLRKYRLYLKHLPSQFHDYDLYENNQLLLFDLLNSNLFSNLKVNLLVLNQPKNLRKMSIEVLEPHENPEVPIRYTPGLISSIKLRALLHNFVRFDNLYIQLKYSEYEIQYIPIDLRKIRMLKANKHSLDTDILVSNSSWTDSSYIKFCISMLLNHDHVNDDDCMSSDTDTVLNDHASIPKTRENFIELTRYVKVYFEPNVKRHAL